MVGLTEPLGARDVVRPLSVKVFLVLMGPVAAAVLGIGIKLMVDASAMSQRVTDIADRVGRIETSASDLGKKIDDATASLHKKADEAQQENQRALGKLQTEHAVMQTQVEALKAASASTKTAAAAP